jgi:hypothetical protein
MMNYLNLLKNRANSEMPLVNETIHWNVGNKILSCLLSWFVWTGIPVNKHLNLKRQFIPTGCAIVNGNNNLT